MLFRRRCEGRPGFFEKGEGIGPGDRSTARVSDGLMVMDTPLIDPLRPCDGCVQRKTVCLVRRSGRSSACTACQAGKRLCTIRETVRKMLASGQLAGPDDVEVVQPQGSDGSTQLILSHVDSLREEVVDLRLKLDERLTSIELRVGETQARPPVQAGTDVVEVSYSARSKGEGKHADGERGIEDAYGDDECEVEQIYLGEGTLTREHGSGAGGKISDGGYVSWPESDREGE